MIKTLIAAVTSAIVAVALTTLKKDRVILKLTKRIKHLESYEEFSDVFGRGWDAGFKQGMHREKMNQIAPYN